MAFEASRWGPARGRDLAAEAEASTKIASAPSMPERVIPSEPSAGLGVAAELSPLDTTVPSCALRAAPSLSSAIVTFARSKVNFGRGSPHLSRMATSIALFPHFPSQTLQGNPGS